MTEAEFLKQVTDLADSLGITWFHIPDSRRIPSARGLPDLYLIGTHDCLWAELKIPGNGLSTDQVTWKYRLIAAGQRYYLFYPEDLYNGTIERELNSLSKIAARAA